MFFEGLRRCGRRRRTAPETRNASLTILAIVCSPAIGGMLRTSNPGTAPFSRPLYPRPGGIEFLSGNDGWCGQDVENATSDAENVTSTCRVETCRGGENRSVSTSRSSNRTGGIPASGSRRRMSCRRPREAPFTSAQLDAIKGVTGSYGLHRKLQCPSFGSLTLGPHAVSIELPVQRRRCSANEAEVSGRESRPTASRAHTAVSKLQCRAVMQQPNGPSKSLEHDPWLLLRDGFALRVQQPRLVRS